MQTAIIFSNLATLRAAGGTWGIKGSVKSGMAPPVMRAPGHLR